VIRKATNNGPIFVFITSLTRNKVTASHLECWICRSAFTSSQILAFHLQGSSSLTSPQNTTNISKRALIFSKLENHHIQHHPTLSSSSSPQRPWNHKRPSSEASATAKTFRMVALVNTNNQSPDHQYVPLQFHYLSQPILSSIKTSIFECSSSHRVGSGASSSLPSWLHPISHSTNFRLLDVCWHMVSFN
jgi:hypothetical protein